MTAHPFLGVACSSALRLGLHVQSHNSPALVSERNCNQSRTFITIRKLDLYSSLILGLPTFLQPQNWETARSTSDPDLSVQYTPTSDKHKYTDTTRLELSSKGVELLRITLDGVRTIFPTASTSKLGNPSGKGDSVNLRDLENIRDQLQIWVKESTISLQHIHLADDYNL